ncbi:hypothetical protein [Phormidium tenue]|uniref:Uncharacterized protein n=1 Tax=Phormidium tenue NIES-30 TaxID=549789 RepID=A0A1U7IXZ6_9CYAN|nr:hypothetical protein [Phormidium tenue]MBD2234944.1 hypothetical protein [Phormidium tenue FACHB-1052]OKH43442.1 hypothetical protein NIES30_24845 [Phormidium tenue NIES-30]
MSNDYVEGLLRLLEQERRKIVSSQKNYKSLVQDFYRKTEPFEEHRPETEESFAEELRLIAEMIAHCIVIGDSDVLYTYAIEPIKADPTRLSSFNNISWYLEAFKDKYRNSQSDSEKVYLWSVINELKIIAVGSAAA